MRRFWPLEGSGRPRHAERPGFHAKLFHAGTWGDLTGRFRLSGITRKHDGADGSPSYAGRSTTTAMTFGPASQLSYHYAVTGSARPACSSFRPTRLAAAATATASTCRTRSPSAASPSSAAMGRPSRPCRWRAESDAARQQQRLGRPGPLRAHSWVTLVSEHAVSPPRRTGRTWLFRCDRGGRDPVLLMRGRAACDNVPPRRLCRDTARSGIA